MNQPMPKNSAMLATDSRLNGKRLGTGRKHGFFYELFRNRVLFLMLLPTLIFFFINSYIPMVGIYYAFTQFDFNTSLFDAKFVGLQNFRFLWQSGTLIKLTLNTVGYNAAFILLGNVLAIVLAILLNELRGRYFKKIAQSVMFLPYFVSFVILSVIVYNIFNYDNGFLNTLLLQFGGERVDV